MRTLSFALVLVASACGTAATSLTAVEQQHALYLREEEKLARDVYRTLGAQDEAPTFANIQESEERHMDAVLGILTSAGLADPALAEDGAFRDPELQALYGALVEQGRRSLADALAVGVQIEELDLDDLEARRATVADPAFLQVIDHLAQGSRHHLAAFHEALVAAGGSYAPRYLTQAQFDAALAAGGQRGR